MNHFYIIHKFSHPLKLKLSFLVLSLTIFVAQSCTKSKVQENNKTNTSSAFKVDIPESSYYSKGLPYGHEHINLYIVESKNNGNPIILFKGAEVSSNQLSEKIDDIIEPRGDYEKHKDVNLFIDRNVEMEFIKSIKQILVSKYLLHINYAVKTPSTLFNRYRLKFVSQYLPPVDDLLDESFDNVFKFSNLIDLKAINDSIFLINDSLINEEDLTKTIKNIILNDSNYAVMINITASQTFSEYLKMIVAAREAVFILRNELALHKYAEKYENLKEEEALIIRQTYPYLEIENDGESRIISEIIILEK